MRKVLAVGLFIVAAAVCQAQDTSATSAADTPAATAPEVTSSAPAADQGASVDAKSSSTKAASRSTRGKKPARTYAKSDVLQPTQLYVQTGCEACAGLLGYLRRCGVSLAVSHVDRGRYNMFPTVIYSDGVSDHGERIYGQQVPLPKKITVEECESGA
jgi:hypothetical protein